MKPCCILIMLFITTGNYSSQSGSKSKQTIRQEFQSNCTTLLKIKTWYLFYFMIIIKSFKRGKSMIYLREQKKHDIWTRWTLTLVLLFLNLFSLHFLLCWHQGFVWQKPASKISNNVLCSHDFHIWFKGNTIKRY